MKITAQQLRKIIKEEIKNAKRDVLSEGHARITQEEFEAWKSGNWGFVSESEEHDEYTEASEQELIDWCFGIMQDPTTSPEKIKSVLGLIPKDSLKTAYNILAKDPMGEPHPEMRDLIKQKFSIR